MKNYIFFLLSILCFVNSYGQKSNHQKNTYIAVYRLGNQTFYDSISTGEEIVIPLKGTELRNKVLGFYRNDEIANNGKPWTTDDITENATVNINGIRFENKKILSKMTDYQIHRFRKDSLYSFRNNEKTGEQTASIRYLRPHAYISQNHQNLPYDFLIFKPKTLELIRYKCSSNSPILDVFNTEDSVIISSKPRVMIDGRLQLKSFDYQNIDLKNVNKIQVFGKEDARKYFGQKVKSGLIAVITNGSNFNLNWTLSNTRVIGEIQDLKGNWSVISDTVLTNIDQFKNYHKDCLRRNGPIYLINGNFETESMNRKNIDIPSIKSVRIVESKKQVENVLNSDEKLTTKDFVDTKKITFIEIGSDTVYIETKSNNSFVTNHLSVSSTLIQMHQVQNPKPKGEIIYIVDNQEIDSEKLKQYKPKELEFVESLEGCDAISKYGKRAEFGVVIYRKKKIE